MSCLACVFASCEKEPEVVPAKGIAVAVSEVTDQSFVITLTPEGVCENYTYVVNEGPAETVDAEKVYAGTLPGVARCAYSYKLEQKATAKVSSLKSGVKYTVYAVCGDANDVPGPVSAVEVTTLDVIDPSLASFSSDGNVVEIAFSEPMQYVAGKAIKATPYCKMFLTGSPASGAVNGEVVSVEGNKAKVKFASITTPGTYYLVNYPEGTFTDLSGNPCPAVSSKFNSAIIAADGSCDCTGIYGWLENADLVYTVKGVAEVDLTKYSTYTISINVPAGVNRVDLADGYKTVVDHADGTVSEYAMAKVINYYGTYYDAVVKFAGEASKGDKVSIVIPAGAIQDWYGNVNAAEIVAGPYNVVSSDTTAPEIASFSSEGNVLTVNFNEPVKFVSGKNVKATPYCKMFLTGSPAGGAVSGEVVSVEGSKATIKFASITTPGTYYVVNIDAGAFTDLSGNGSAAAVTSKFTSAIIAADGSCSCDGVYGWLANGELVYKAPAAANLSITKYSSTTYSVNVPAGVNRVDLADGYKTVITHADGTKSEYTMAKVTNYYGTYYDAVVKFAGSAVVGDKASIIIPAGAIQDWYGNVNSKEIVVGPMTIVD